MPVGDKDSAFYLPPQYIADEEMRREPRMLLGGDKGSATAALKAEKDHWLPPYATIEMKAPAGGGRSAYDKRVESAVVRPFYRKAVERMVATILAEPIVFEDDVPVLIRGTRRSAKPVRGGILDKVLAAIQRVVAGIAGDAIAGRVVRSLRGVLAPLLGGVDSRPTGEEQVEGWVENIDLRGNNVDVFMRPVVLDLSGEGGASAILVDHPIVPIAASGDDVLSRADISQQRLRPFWRHYRARDILEATPEYPNGREAIRSVRLLDGVDEQGREQVRILEAAPFNETTGRREGYATWITVAKAKGENGEETEEETGRGPMKPHQEIPLAVGYFSRAGFLRGLPQQLELAHMNLRHTRQDCEIADDLSISSGAQFVASGFKKEEAEAIVLGKRMKVISSETGARAEWLERSGSAATVFMDYQKRQEDEMRSLGALPLIERTGNLTATGQAIDSAQARTEAQYDSMVVKDMLERALTFTAMYLDPSKAEDAKGGSVRLRLPSILIERNADGIRLLTESRRENGVPTRRTILRTLINQGWLPDDVDVDQELAEAAAEEEQIRLAMEAARTALAAQNVPPQPMMKPGGGMATGAVSADGNGGVQ